MPTFAVHFYIRSNVGPAPGLNPRQIGNASLFADHGEQATAVVLAFLSNCTQLNRMAHFKYEVSDIKLSEPTEFEPGPAPRDEDFGPWNTYETLPQEATISIHLHNHQGRTYARYSVLRAMYENPEDGLSGREIPGREGHSS